jgi:AmmeMemoRadiSam system protein A
MAIPATSPAINPESKVYDLDEGTAEEVHDNPATGVEFGLTTEDKKILLYIARQAIITALNDEKLPPPESITDGLIAQQGAFVTLNKEGTLRGCIGTFTATEPLYLTVARMAREAAFSDPRFNPVEKNEVDHLHIEISVLTPMKKINDPESVEVGRDGLYIRQGFRSGVLLPQVPVEYGWDRMTFLQHTCLKAGLPTDAWKAEGTELFVFQAEIFGED